MAKKKRSAKQLANDKRLGRMARARAAERRGGSKRAKRTTTKRTTTTRTKRSGGSSIAALTRTVHEHSEFIHKQKMVNSMFRDAIGAIYQHTGIAGPSHHRRLGSGR